MKGTMAWWIVGVLMVVMLAFSCSASENSVHLSEEEIAFIQAHPVFRLGIDPDFVPFEFLNENDQYTGITADYLDLIRERTGLQFEVVPGLTWPEAYNLALAGEIDVLPSVGRTDEREEHFLLSKPYYHFKRAIVTKDTDTDISGMDDLEGHMVAVHGIVPTIATCCPIPESISASMILSMQLSPLLPQEKKRLL